jgi:hypothetical protein
LRPVYLLREDASLAYGLWVVEVAWPCWSNATPRVALGEVAAGTTSGLVSRAFLTGRASDAVAIAVLDLWRTGQRVPVVPVVTVLGAEINVPSNCCLLDESIGRRRRNGATGISHI